MKTSEIIQAVIIGVLLSAVLIGGWKWRQETLGGGIKSGEAKGGEAKGSARKRVTQQPVAKKSNPPKPSFAAIQYPFGFVGVGG